MVVASSLHHPHPHATYMRQWIGSTLLQITACRLFSTKPLSKPNAGSLSIRPLETTFSEIVIKIQNDSFTKMHLKLSSAKWRPFCPGEMRYLMGSPCPGSIVHTNRELNIPWTHIYTLSLWTLHCVSYHQNQRHLILRAICSNHGKNN